MPDEPGDRRPDVDRVMRCCWPRGSAHGSADRTDRCRDHGDGRGS